MSTIFRDTAAGYFIRFIIGKKLLRYPEEMPGFEIPKPENHVTNNSYADEKVRDEDLGNTEFASNTSTKSRDVELGVGTGFMEPTMSQAIHPVVTKNGIIFVDWYSTGRQVTILFSHRH
jgi:DHA1 family multidrug resistance protein-like MFS transporter